MLAQKVEETIRQTGAAQIEANDIGLAILPPLRDLDEVAYLRFASVYQGFDSLDDFESAIAQLRIEHTITQASKPAQPADGVTASTAGEPPTAPPASSINTAKP